MDVTQRKKERQKFIVDTVDVIKENLENLFDNDVASRKHVAEKCLISQSNISRWLSRNNIYIPEVYYLKIIADHFGVTVDWILTDHKDEQ